MKLAIRLWGKSRMNPTVSLSSTGPQPGKLPAAGSRVERGEELVFGQLVRTGELVEQRALAGVRVADERDGHPVVAGGDLALLAAEHFVEVVAEIGDSPFDEPTVCFQLLFARAAHADAGLDAGQVGPHPLEPRERVFELGEFDREPGFVRLGARRENIENHFGAIEHLDAQGTFQIANLGGGEIVVEDHGVGIGGPDHQFELFDLALAEISGLIGDCAALGQSADDFGPGRFDQTSQLVENCRRAAWLIGQDRRRPKRPTRFVRPACGRFPSLVDWDS